MVRSNVRRKNYICVFAWDSNILSNDSKNGVSLEKKGATYMHQSQACILKKMIKSIKKIDNVQK